MIIFNKTRKVLNVWKLTKTKYETKLSKKIISWNEYYKELKFLNKLF